MKRHLHLYFIFFLISLVFTDCLSAQNIDSLSYHAAKQLSDSSYSLKKSNGDSTVFIFESSNLISNGSADSVLNHKITAKNLNLYGIKEFANDSMAIVDGGLLLNDVYRTGNLLKIVSSFPKINFLTFDIDNQDGTASPKFELDNYDGTLGNFEVTVDWGDGVENNFSGNYDYILEHDYESNKVFHVKVTIDNINKVQEFEFKASPSKSNLSLRNRVILEQQRHSESPTLQIQG